MQEGDKDFLRGMQDKLEGNFPGLPDMLKLLQQEELGRAIATTEENPVSNEITYNLQGYILPLTKDQLSHLIVLRTGRMLVIKSHDADFHQREYRNTFSPSSEPLKYHYTRTPDSIAADLKMGVGKILADNIHPAEAHFFDNAVEDAISCAQEAKREREIAKERTVGKFMQRLNETLFKKPEPPTQPFQDPPSGV